MKRIGILYLCTGPYVVFWKDFFESFEKNFMPNTEKHYYVFSDSLDIYAADECNRVHTYNLQAQPWPLVTLLRFNTFLSIKEDLKNNDYLMFSNANIVCDAKVVEGEILPKDNQGLFFTMHPGYLDAKPKNMPFERRRNSTAYVSYKEGKKYVIGAFFGGKTKDFLEMSEELHEHICKDLKNNIIALWHDESHINWYIHNHSNYRLISSSYCYPWGLKADYEKKISAVSKIDKFDVNGFKGVDMYEKKASIVKRFMDYIMIRR